MSPFNKSNKVTDIEQPFSTNIHGRDILGINPNIKVMSKSALDIEDEESSIDFISKIK